jgi:acylphosphatase
MQAIMNVVRARALVSGRVQGVFFRDSAREVARRLGLTGWVRNRPDGRVEAEFQGARDAVDEALDFCRRGPDLAVVDDIEVAWLDPVDAEAGFRVR